MMRIGCSFVVDNGSSHRGQTSVVRMRRRDKRINLVHTPVHAQCWLNLLGRDLLFDYPEEGAPRRTISRLWTPFACVWRLHEDLSNRTPRPFAWKFTRQDLLNWLQRASPHF